MPAKENIPAFLGKVAGNPDSPLLPVPASEDSARQTTTTTLSSDSPEVVLPSPLEQQQSMISVAATNLSVQGSDTNSTTTTEGVVSVDANLNPTTSNTVTLCPNGQPLVNDRCNVPPGYYYPAGATEAQPCPRNTYETDGIPYTSCTPCLSGMWSNSGSTSCFVLSGYYYLPGAPAALPCPANTYQHFASDGSRVCSPCPFGTTSSPGSTTCVAD